MNRVLALSAVMTVIALPALACEEFLSVVRFDEAGAEAGMLAYDEISLGALERKTITTAMPWIDGSSTFEGPSLAAVIGPVGEGAHTLSARALDGYEVEMPLDPLLDHGVIIADRRDGAPMEIRERGPLWMVFPFSDTPEIDTPDYHSRTVWQLCAVDIW